MSIIIEEIENVTVRREVFAPLIRINGNPEDTLAGTVFVEMHRLEYHDDTLTHTTPLDSVGETVGMFVERSFTVGEKTITGVEVMLLIKQYVADLHAERVAATTPAPVVPGDE